MTSQPTTTTLYEVISRADGFRTVGYFETGDEARAYAATIEGAYTMIYLKPVR